jgi:hypothetical protein
MINFTKEAWEQYGYWQNTDKTMVEAIEEFRLKGKGLSFSGRMGLKQTSLALGRRIQWIGERMKGVGFGGLDWGKGKDLHWVLGEIKETRRY